MADEKKNKIEIDKREWEAVMDRLGKLETDSSSTYKPLERAKEHVCRVAFYDGQPIIEWGQAKSDHFSSRATMKMPIKTLDGKVHEISYAYFVDEVPKYVTKIVNERRKERDAVRTQDGGGGIQPKISADNGMKIEEMVELTVTYIDVEYDVQFIEGEAEGLAFTINGKFVNPT